MSSSGSCRSWPPCAPTCRWSRHSIPLGALLAFVLSLVVARGSLELLRDENPAARTTRGEWILVAVLVVVVLFLSFSGSPDA